MLQDAGSSYQRTRTWCPTGTAQRKRKAGVVTVVDPQTEEKGLIDSAYRVAEAMGIPCGARMRPARTRPSRSQVSPGSLRASRVGQPHEYIRGGTAKLLTLFRPATGQVRAKGVTNAPNVVLHPWLTARTARRSWLNCPTYAADDAELPTAAQWATWLGHVPHLPLPPLRLILVWDNLAGHLSTSMVIWLFAHGVMPLYTPLSGSWLNMAESVQRIICGRALNGQHPKTAARDHHLVGGHGRWLECGSNCRSSGTANAESAGSAPNNADSAAPPPFPITS